MTWLRFGQKRGDMAKCQLCGKSSLFLKLTKEGLCESCNKRVQEIVDNIHKKTDRLADLIKQINSAESYVETTALFNEAIALSQDLMKDEEQGFVKLVTPAKEIYKQLIESKDEYLSENTDSKNTKQTKPTIDNASDVLKTRSHYCMLMYFLKPRTLYSILMPGWKDEWASGLKENPDITIKKIVDAGLIIKAPFEDHISVNFTIPDLKELIKSKGGNTKGKKNGLVQEVARLYTPQELQPKFNHNDVYVCTEKGADIGIKFQSNEEEREKTAREKIQSLILQEKYDEAKKVKADFESLYPWPTPFGYSLDVVIPDPNNKGESYVDPGAPWLHVEEIKRLKREEKYQEARDLLLKCVDWLETNQQDERAAGHSYYYKELGIVYRKLKDYVNSNKYDMLYEDGVIEEFFRHKQQVEELPKKLKEEYYPNGPVLTKYAEKIFKKRGISPNERRVYPKAEKPKTSETWKELGERFGFDWSGIDDM